MSKNQHIGALQLEADIRENVIDTVIVAFSDHQGQLIGKRTDGEFYLDVVAEEGTENCDYLIACDIEDVPIPGFRWASYDQGYGDMRGVVDTATIRYLPWLERTAVVLVDLVDVDSGAPVAVSPRRILQDQADKAATLGYVAMIGSEVEFFLFKETFDDANAAGYRRAHAELAVPRGLSHPADDEGGGCPRRDPARPPRRRLSGRVLEG